MSECLPNDGIKFDGKVNSEDIFNFLGDSDIGYFVECDLLYPGNIKEKKLKPSPFALKIGLVLRIKVVIE